MDKKLIVISGINLIDGGALSVYQDFLRSIIKCKYSLRYRIIAFVGKNELFDEFDGKIEFIELRKSKSNWLLRLYYEYMYFWGFSKKEKPYIWISMHDITPRVIAHHRYVYCHNPSPFNNMKLSEARYGWKYYLFSKFYKYLYAINIKKNDAVIVQQDWMRKEFRKMYGINNIIVARPSLPKMQEFHNIESEETIFVYPSYPRYYKNFQVVCDAVKIIYEKGLKNFRVYLTLDGHENKYSKMLYRKYKHLDSVVFCGLLPRNELFELYERSNCLLFLSKIETWGMPITEFKNTDKSMILADLPYSHETVGNYENVSFVDADDPKTLAEKMIEVIEGKRFENKSEASNCDEPFANDWDELGRLIFE